MSHETQSFEPHVCPPGIVHRFDNFLRPFIHNPKKLFGPYLKPGQTALDVGCGRGFASIGMARLVGSVGRVVSADLQPEMLDMLRERARSAGVLDRITFHRCESDRIGWNGKADFALAFWMLHETPDPAQFFSELSGIVKENGALLIVEPKGHVRKKAFEESIRLGEANGFVLAERPKVRLSLAALFRLPS